MKTVPLEALGLCEHCNTLVSLLGMPADSLDAIWRCTACEGKLSHLSFGFDRSSQGAQRIRWVGPNGQWIDQRPADDFKLGNLLVEVLPPHREFFW